MDCQTTYVAAPPPKTELQWVRAVRALAQVLEDSSRSEKVFEIAMSLEGPGMERAFQQFIREPGGLELLKNRRSLLASVSDRDRLASLPDNTFGHAYYRYMQQERLDGEGLVKAMEAAIRDDDPQARLDPDRQYFRERNRDSHDLWHALTGYGADQLGEAALLAFTFAQLPNVGVGLILSMAFLLPPIGIPNEKFGWQPYLIQAYRRGKAARWLPAVALEDYLDWPLEKLQRDLKIVPARRMHPGGIYAYNDGDPKVRRIRVA